MSMCHYQTYDIDNPPIHLNEDDILYDTFKDIPGYEGRYQMNEQGVVRRIYKNNKARELYPTRNHNQVRYTLVDDKGNKKAFSATRLTCMMYGITVPNGYSIIHKNGLKTENDIYNLAMVDNKTLTKYHTHGEIQVNKIRVSDGKVVYTYPSIKACAKAHNVGEDTMRRWAYGITPYDKRIIFLEYDFKIKTIAKDRKYNKPKGMKVKGV